MSGSLGLTAFSSGCPPNVQLESWRGTAFEGMEAHRLGGFEALKKWQGFKTLSLHNSKSSYFLKSFAGSRRRRARERYASGAAEGYAASAEIHADY